MTEFRADLHIHTLLSPCGDLEMTPGNIIAKALEKGLDIIGITDHNTTRHCRLAKKLGDEAGLLVMTGAEVTTKEEIHCLVFFENLEIIDRFQLYLDQHLPEIMNVPELFGDQVQIDENENIIYTEPRMLHNATDLSLEALEEYVHSMGGIFAPSHIDRHKNSICSQLGFVPEGLKADALEISVRCRREEFFPAHPEVSSYTILTNSDSHYLSSIGAAFNIIRVEKPSFDEVRMALRDENGRRIIR